MRIGRTEQWLLLAVLLAAAAWVVVLVYARLTTPGDHRPADRAAGDAGPVTAEAPPPQERPVTAAPEMVFSVDEIPQPTTAAPATAAPATAAPATGLPATASTPGGGPGAPERSATILVVSEPAGARVMDTGTSLGRTPMRFPRPSPQGEARYLLVQKTGYRSVRIAITPTSPDRIEVTLRLPEP